MQNDLNNILNKTKNKIEDINKETNQLKIIFKELNNKQSKYYLNILKKETDTRMEGLSWVVKRLIELNMSIDSTIFPGFLDQEQINYIIQISKYEYEISQLKMALEALKARQIEESKDKIILKNNTLSTYEDKYLSSPKSNIIYKRNMVNIDDKKSNNKLLLNFLKSKKLRRKHSKIMNSENIKIKQENDAINSMIKNIKNKLILYARDNSFDIIDKNDFKSNILNYFLSNDSQKEYFHDAFIFIERINELNKLIKELKKEEFLIFEQKFKFSHLKKEIISILYKQVFNALFGNLIFKPPK